MCQASVYASHTGYCVHLGRHKSSSTGQAASEQPGMKKGHPKNVEEKQREPWVGLLEYPDANQ